MRSWGMATNPAGQAPVVLSAKATWVRWLVLSMFLPSQQPGKSCTRSTFRPAGQIGYLSERRSVKPEQIQVARALAGPRLVGLASPVSSRRNLGIGVTLLVALPRYSISTAAGRRMPPVLLGSSRLGPCGSGNGAADADGLGEGAGFVAPLSAQPARASSPAG